MPDRQPNTALITVIVLVVLAGATFGTIALTKKSDSDNKDDAENGASQNNTQNQSANPGDSNSSSYKDGTYSATGAYTTPGGQETITVSVTLANDVITDTNAKASGIANTSKEYQAKFIGGYANMIIGKKLDEVSLSRVSGSSLTSSGFNNAIQTIRQDAENS